MYGKENSVYMDYFDEINEIWSMVKDRMKQQIGSNPVNLWFGDIEITSFFETTLILTTSSAFKEKNINDRFLSQIEDLFEEFMGFHIDIVIRAKKGSVDIKTLRQQLKTAKTPEEEEKYVEKYFENQDEDEMPPVIGSTMPTVNFEYTFSNFIVGSSNKFAHAACIAVADKPAQDYNPLFIYGPSGLGKTHLLYAVTNQIKLSNPFANIIYIKGEDFTNQMIESIRTSSMDKFRDKYRTCDVLLIDDIQFVAGKDSTQEEFFHTFNALYEEGKQIILTSDRPPKDIKTLEDRLMTRFEWGLIADIQPPDFELRVAILKNKITQAGITVSDDIITYLAENLRSHIRQIEGAVKKLVAIKFLSGSEITMEVAKNCITELLGGAEPVNVTVDKIFNAIENKYDIGKVELVGKSRVKEIAQARHVAIYLIREITEMSLPNIGKIFNRDHATIISSIDTVKKKINTSPAAEIEINELIKEING